MHLRSSSPPPNASFPVPETDPTSHDHCYQHKDGRAAMARLELRSNGVWDIDLREFNAGRPTQKEPGQKFGVKTLHTAKVCANRVLSGLVDAKRGPRPDAAPTGWKKQVVQHLAGKRASGADGPENRQAGRVRDSALPDDPVRSGCPASHVKRTHIGQLVVALRTLLNERTVEPLSNRYIRQHLMYLGGLFSWALDLELLESNSLANHMSVPSSPDQGRRLWLEPSQAQALQDAVREKPHHESPHLFWLFAVMLYAGMGPADRAAADRARDYAVRSRSQLLLDSFADGRAGREGWKLPVDQLTNIREMGHGKDARRSTCSRMCCGRSTASPRSASSGFGRLLSG